MELNFSISEMECSNLTYGLLSFSLFSFNIKHKMGTLENRAEVIQSIFEEHDSKKAAELTALQLQILYSDIRIGGLSLPQVTRHYSSDIDIWLSVYSW